MAGPEGYQYQVKARQDLQSTQSVHRAGELDGHQVNKGIGAIPLAKEESFFIHLIGKFISLLDRKIFNSSTPTSSISINNIFQNGKLADEFGFRMRELSKATKNGKTNYTLAEFQRSQLYKNPQESIRMRDAVQQYRHQLADLIIDIKNAVTADELLSGGKASPSLMAALEGYENELKGVDIWLHNAEAVVADQIFEDASIEKLANQVTVKDYLNVIGKGHPHYEKLNTWVSDGGNADKKLTELPAEIKTKKGLNVAKVDLMRAMPKTAVQTMANQNGRTALLPEIYQPGYTAPESRDATALNFSLGIPDFEKSGVIRNLKIGKHELNFAKDPGKVGGFLQRIGRDGLRKSNLIDAVTSFQKATGNEKGQISYESQRAFFVQLDVHKANLQAQLDRLEAIQKKQPAGAQSKGLNAAIDGIKMELEGLRVLKAVQDQFLAAKILGTEKGKAILKAPFRTSLMALFKGENSYLSQLNNGTKTPVEILNALTSEERVQLFTSDRRTLKMAGLMSKGTLVSDRETASGKVPSAAPGKNLEEGPVVDLSKVDMEDHIVERLPEDIVADLEYSNVKKPPVVKVNKPNVDPKVSVDDQKEIQQPVVSSKDNTKESVISTIFLDGDPDMDFGDADVEIIKEIQESQVDFFDSEEDNNLAGALELLFGKEPEPADSRSPIIVPEALAKEFEEDPVNVSEDNNPKVVEDLDPEIQKNDSIVVEDDAIVNADLNVDENNLDVEDAAKLESSKNDLNVEASEQSEEKQVGLRLPSFDNMFAESVDGTIKYLQTGNDEIFSACKGVPGEDLKSLATILVQFSRTNTTASVMSEVSSQFAADLKQLKEDPPANVGTFFENVSGNFDRLMNTLSGAVMVEVYGEGVRDIKHPKTGQTMLDIMTDSQKMSATHDFLEAYCPKDMFEQWESSFGAFDELFDEDDEGNITLADDVDMDQVEKAFETISGLTQKLSEHLESEKQELFNTSVKVAELFAEPVVADQNPPPLPDRSSSNIPSAPPPPANISPPPAPPPPASSQQKPSANNPAGGGLLSGIAGGIGNLKKTDSSANQKPVDPKDDLLAAIRQGTALKKTGIVTTGTDEKNTNKDDKLDGAPVSFNLDKLNAARNRFDEVDVDGSDSDDEWDDDWND